MSTQFDFDVDIDLANRDQALKHLPHTRASIHRDGKVTPHNTGVYFQNIERDPVTDLAVLDHKVAESQGYFKVDFLNNTVYQSVQDPEHLDRLSNTDPDWSLLEYPEIVETLYHINNHFDIVSAYEPRCVEDLAAVLALIRPAKRHLLGQPLPDIQQELWQPPQNSDYYFKRSHAIAFATVIVVQMNLLSGV